MATVKRMNNHVPIGVWVSCPYSISTACAACFNLKVVEVLSSTPDNFSVFPGCHNSMEQSSQFQS